MHVVGDSCEHGIVLCRATRHSKTHCSMQKDLHYHHGNLQTHLSDPLQHTSELVCQKESGISSCNLH